MKSVEQIRRSISIIENKITDCKLRGIRYESIGDFHMLQLCIVEEAQYKGQLSAIKWVLGEVYK